MLNSYHHPNIHLSVDVYPGLFQICALKLDRGLRWLQALTRRQWSILTRASNRLVHRHLWVPFRPVDCTIRDNAGATHMPCWSWWDGQLNCCLYTAPSGQYSEWENWVLSAVTFGEMPTTSRGLLLLDRVMGLGRTHQGTCKKAVVGTRSQHARTSGNNICLEWTPHGVGLYKDEAIIQGNAPLKWSALSNSKVPGGGWQNWSRLWSWLEKKVLWELQV